MKTRQYRNAIATGISPKNTASDLLLASEVEACADRDAAMDIYCPNPRWSALDKAQYLYCWKLSAKVSVKQGVANARTT